MLTRRSLLRWIAALPIVGWFVPKGVAANEVQTVHLSPPIAGTYSLHWPGVGTIGPIRHHEGTAILVFTADGSVEVRYPDGCVEQAAIEAELTDEPTAEQAAILRSLGFDC